MRRLRETNNEGYDILWQAIEEYIDKTGFKREECGMISGDDEGLYGWVAANYSAGTFNSKEGTFPPSRGFVETGGESAQIAFSVERDDCDTYKGQLTFLEVGGRPFNLFTRTWLGLGANAIWKRHEKKMLESDGVIVYDPCLPKQYSRRHGDKIIVGTGNLYECVGEIFSFIRCKNQGCLNDCWCVDQGNGCLINDAPSLGTQARDRQFLGASVYWHATHGVFGGGKSQSEQESYSLKNFSEEVTNFSAMNWAEIKARYPQQDHKYLWNSFFNAGLIMTTLHLGFGVPIEDNTSYSDESPRPSGPFKTINATWTLGRIILHAIDAKPEVRNRRGWGAGPDHSD